MLRLKYGKTMNHRKEEMLKLKLLTSKMRRTQNAKANKREGQPLPRLAFAEDTI